MHLISPLLKESAIIVYNPVLIYAPTFRQLYAFILKEKDKKRRMKSLSKIIDVKQYNVYYTRLADCITKIAWYIIQSLLYR